MKCLALIGVLLSAVPAGVAAKRAAGGQPDRVFTVLAGPGPKSKAEVAAVEAVLHAQSQSPDERIRTAGELIAKFPKTDFRSFALYTEADAYEVKGEHAKAIVFCQQALSADAGNFEAEILMANVIAAGTRDTDLEKAEKLTNAVKFAKEALEVIPQAPKPILFRLTDEEWSAQKDAAASRAWQALGLVAAAEKKRDEAIADFEKGLAFVPDPVLMVRTSRALEASGKYGAALGWLDKALAAPAASAQIREVAAKDRARVAAEQARTQPAQR